jgi:hypothetical protein
VPVIIESVVPAAAIARELAAALFAPPVVRLPREYGIERAMTDDPRIEYQLVQDGTLFEEIELLDTKIVPTLGAEDWAVTVEFRVEEELVARCAFGLIYVLGLLSFHDGRPRGISGKWFEDDDEFTAADMLHHLTFERGTLKMYVDYLRGRCIKTDVAVSSNGHVFLKTVNRGQAATRWVDRLRGKKFLKPVEA